MDVSPRAVPPPTAAERFAALEDRHPVEEYNFENFCTRHLLEDGRRTIERAGIRRASRRRTSSCRRWAAAPCASPSCAGGRCCSASAPSPDPPPFGSVEPLKKLHARWGDDVHSSRC